ncbi:MAG TPA: hypothetical protein VFX17_01150 [Patescibacteria group bacterium]|nr:hypothetical protein [Patescibacteria group bacterium]
MAIQGGILAPFGLSHFGNLALVFVVMVLTISDRSENLYLALIAGLLMDFASGLLLGTFVVCMLAVFGFTYLFVKLFIQRTADRKLVLLSSVLLNTIVLSLCFCALEQLAAHFHLPANTDWHNILGRKLLLDLAANAILTYPIYWLYVFMEKLQYRFERI